MPDMIELVDFNTVQKVTSKQYFSKDKYASDMFNVKYCNEKEDGQIETPADVFLRVASNLAAFEKTHQDMYTNMWFSLMWNGWFRPGGSVLAGIGAKNRQSLLNCTTVPLEEDSIESIAKCDYAIMKCAAFRQGLGIDASVLRPRGAPVRNAAQESTGVVPWITKLVDNGKYVGQRGRIPALLVSLKIEHPDIKEFIASKSKLGVIENANISVQVSDAFMRAIENKEIWQLRFDFDDDRESIIENIDAGELFNLIAETAHSSAEPGVQFIDQLRKGSMVHQIYEATGDKKYQLISTNACSEKTLPPFGVCNLLSINMEMFSTDPEIYIKELEYIAPLLSRFSDNVVSYELENNLSPVPEQAYILAQTREIGCGITNLHGWFLKQDLAYDSQKAIDCAENFFKYYAYNVFKSSVELGLEKGNAPAWDILDDKKPFMHSIYFSNIVNAFYAGDHTTIRNMRNLAHMSVAPAGSISSTFPVPCLSSGVEPIIASAYWRRTRAVDKGNYTHYFVIPDKVKQYVLNKIDKTSNEYKQLVEFSGSEQDEDGTIGNALLNIINDTVSNDFFKPAHMIDPIRKIELMSKMYKWIDSSISVTYNLPSTVTKEDISNIYLEAYKKGVRAVSVYVEGSREGVLIFEDPLTNAAKFEKRSSDRNICADENKPKTITVSCAPERPRELPCDIWRTSIKGETWIVLVGLLHGLPFEIFCGQSDELYLPQTCKEGVVRKEKSGTYELEVVIRRSSVIFKDLTNLLMTDNEKALTRLLSLSLRHGVLPQFIVDQLKKSNGNITAFSTAISRVLAKYVKGHLLSEGKNICPTCGEHSLMYTSGCVKCVAEDCNYTRCE